MSSIREKTPRMSSRAGITAANAAWLAFCFPAYREFRSAIKNPERAQARVLDRLLRANADSTYGKQWRFSHLRKAKEFQCAVPITSYEELVPWIERIMDGEQRVLTSEPVLMLERTSGSSSAAKYIPYTKSLRKEFQRAVAAWMCDLYVHHPKLLRGNAYWSVTSLARQREVTKGGLNVGFESDTEYFGRFQKKLLHSLMAVPDELAHIPELDTSIYATLRFLIQSSSLSFISVWHPSFLTILANHLKLHSDRLIADLYDGDLRPPSSISSSTLAVLKKYLCKDTSRARKLEKFFQKCGQLPVHELWPGLEIISCWTDAAAQSAVPALQQEFPSAKIQGKGLLATEGFVSIPMCGEQGCAVAVTSHFYEFLEDGSTLPKLVHELELGREYSVLLTTGGGLWRYKLGDRVRIVGYCAQTPLLEFIGKEGDVSDLCGEKLNSIFVGRVLQDLAAENAYSADFAMLAPSLENQPRYLLFLQGRINESQLAERLDEKLKANPHYSYCRALGQLAPPQIFLIREDAAESFLRRSTQLGIRAGSIKPTPLHRSTGWENHFHGRFIEQENRAAQMSCAS